MIPPARRGGNRRHIDEREVVNEPTIGCSWKPSCWWRALAAMFGNWNSLFQRFRRRAVGVFERLFTVLSGDPDFDYARIDGTIVRVRRRGTGAKGRFAIRRSRCPFLIDERTLIQRNMSGFG